MNFQLPNQNYKKAEGTDFYLELKEILEDNTKRKEGYFLSETYRGENPYYSWGALRDHKGYFPLGYTNETLYRYYIDMDGEKHPSCTLDGIGIRPATSYSKLKEELEILEEKKIGSQSIVVAGEWIQDRVASDTEWELKELSKSHMIRSTGKSYHVGTATFKEKIYNNKKYIKVKHSDSEHWFLIHPLEWNIDKLTDTAISRKILFPARYLQSDNFVSEQAHLDFLNHVFSKEITLNPNDYWSYDPNFNIQYANTDMRQQVFLEEKRIRKRMKQMENLLNSGKPISQSDREELIDLLVELQSTYCINYEQALKKVEQKRKK